MPGNDDDDTTTEQPKLVAELPKLPWYKRWFRWVWIKLGLGK